MAGPLRGHRCWIFDMDGTLTVPVHDFEAIRRVLGLAPGTPILEAIAAMPAAAAEAATRRLHEMEMALAARAAPQPGIAAVLARLADGGRQLGILTRNAEAVARVTLEAAGLDAWFRPECVVGQESCPPKPRPDGVHHLLRQWRAAPGEAVLVGDYLFDIQAGREAGVTTVHFDASGRFPWPEYTDHRVRAVADLGTLL